MGRLSPSHYDDVFLDKSKSVIIHILAQLNKHGEIPHALALAPKARRERHTILAGRLGETFCDDQVSEESEEGERRKEKRRSIRREMAKLSEFTYEQLVEYLDPDDKFFKRLTEIIIKETAAQAYNRLQKEEAAAASADQAGLPPQAMTGAFATRARTALGNSGSMYFLARDESGLVRSRSSSSSSNLTSISSASGDSPPPRDAATTRISRVGRLSQQDLSASTTPSASSVRADLMARRASLTAQRQALQLSREERRRERILRHIDSERPSNEISAPSPATAPNNTIPSTFPSSSSLLGEPSQFLSLGAPTFVSRPRASNFHVARSSSTSELSTVPFPTGHGAPTTGINDVTASASSQESSRDVFDQLNRTIERTAESLSAAETPAGHGEEPTTSLTRLPAMSDGGSLRSLPRDLEARHQALEASLERMRALRTSPERVGTSPHQQQEVGHTTVTGSTPPSLRRSGASRASLRWPGARSNSGARRIEDFTAFAARRRSGARQQDDHPDRVRSPPPELQSAHQTFEEAFRTLQRAATSIEETLGVSSQRDARGAEATDDDGDDVGIEIDGESGMAARYELASAGVSLTEGHLRSGTSSQRPIARLPSRQPTHTVPGGEQAPPR